MPCRPDETFAQGPEPPNPVMPSDSTGNDGAGHADPDAENTDSESDLEAPQKQKRARTLLAYEVVQRWVTGDRAELTDQEIQTQLEVEASKLMELSGQKKFPCHKALDTDLGCWKLCRTHSDKRGVLFQVYRCPMRHRCKCKCCIRVVTSKDYIELPRYCLHDRNSHDDDASKKRTYAQRVSVKEAAKTAPTLSGAALRRNLGDHHSPTKNIPPSLKRSVQHIVYTVRKDMSAQHLGSEVDDSFGNLLKVEVSWRDIKKLCSAGCTLAYFLSMLCKFVRTVLGEEHRQALVDMGTPNALLMTRSHRRLCGMQCRTCITRPSVLASCSRQVPD